MTTGVCLACLQDILGNLGLMPPGGVLVNEHPASCPPVHNSEVCSTQLFRGPLVRLHPQFPIATHHGHSLY